MRGDQQAAGADLSENQEHGIEQKIFKGCSYWATLEYFSLFHRLGCASRGKVRVANDLAGSQAKNSSVGRRGNEHLPRPQDVPRC